MTESNGLDFSAENAFAHPMGPRFEGSLKDMRFIGWVSLICGILTCISIVGLPLGIPMIIAANRFIEGVNRFETYRVEGNASELRAGFDDLGRSFRILKILTVIYIVLMGLYFFALFFLGGLGLLVEFLGS
jgi:Family of unknown function (DUF5362)